MGCREVLGRADVDDERLLAMVAAQLGEPADQVEIVSVEARAVDYALPAITTAGRWWVDGQARAGGVHRPFRFFVKHVQSWAQHPFFAQVPAEYRVGRGSCRALAHRAERLPIRSGRPAPRRLDHAALVRCVRRRRRVGRGVAG